MKKPKLDVFVLDDDLDFRLYIEDLLADDGHRVVTFAEPQALLEACAQRLPDIVFLDMKMGNYSGTQVLEQIRLRWPDLCVVIVTGYPSMEDMRASLQHKIFDYLAKPFSLEELRSTLERAAIFLKLDNNEEKLRERLGNRIKVLRIERRWALKDLAARCGLSISQLSSIERGIHLPSLEALLAISNALNKKPSEILLEIGF
ncbi:MAG: response regulator [Acidobacteriota bacterium]|nr:response regulator [Blastocatellia bacterium]MDW8413006.1 response regulator [Acidobacteriota bacterium]